MTDLRPSSDAGSPWLRPVFCTGVGLIGNVLLATVKIIVGVAASSAALVADGFHSLADVLSDIGILFALKAANRPPDANHPYGHHSFETLGAVIVAAFMLLTAGLIGWDAVRNFLNGEVRHPEPPALIAAVASIVIKEVMARYTISVGRRHNSPALLANGLMHRSDAISSVAAALGIAGAMVRWPLLDNLAALVVAVFIARMGWNLLHENVMTLMDTMPDPELVEAIRGEAASVPEVQEIRDLRVRQRGSWYLADLRVAVQPDLSLGVAHDIAHEVEDRVRERVPNVARVFVHVEPGRPEGGSASS